MPQVTIINSDAATALGTYHGVPDTCPVCQNGIQTLRVGGDMGWMRYFKNASSDRRLQMLFRCPRQMCGSVFIAEYDQRGGTDYHLMDFRYPLFPKEAEYPEGVVNISTSHAKIFGQALLAEARGLDEIAGIGYRKSLEFLIKDYCISKNTAIADQIKKKPLGVCIKDHVSNANVKSCAERATWLGNDETHYERIWSGHDISHLKTLIKLTQQWISTEYLTAKYLVEIQKGKEPAKTV